MTAYWSQPIVADVLTRREQQVRDHLQERAVGERRARLLGEIWPFRGGWPRQPEHRQPITGSSSGDAAATAR